MTLSEGWSKVMVQLMDLRSDPEESVPYILGSRIILRYLVVSSVVSLSLSWITLVIAEFGSSFGHQALIRFGLVLALEEYVGFSLSKSCLVIWRHWSARSALIVSKSFPEFDFEMSAAKKLT